MSEKSGNYQIVLSTRLDTAKIKTDLAKLKDVKINVEVNVTDKSIKNLQELSKVIDAIKVTSKELVSSGSISKGTRAIKEIGVQSEKSAQQVKTFGEKAVDAFQKFSLWSVISNIFYKIVRAAEGLVNTAIELDSAFTELSKVTDITRDDFDKLTQQAYELGSEVAKTTTEVINAMTEFAKAGYTIEESSEILAKNALMWTNISDGTVSASDAANMIISVMKAFNMEAEDTTHIIDALNEVSNNYAISSGQLSDSLSRSAAVLANTGTTYEQMLGLVTGITEVTRNANKASTALRTIRIETSSECPRTKKRLMA